MEDNDAIDPSDLEVLSIGEQKECYDVVAEYEDGETISLLKQGVDFNGHLWAFNTYFKYFLEESKSVSLGWDAAKIRDYCTLIWNAILYIKNTKSRSN